MCIRDRCEPVLTEACFLLTHGVQRARLERLLVELRVQPYAPDDAAALWPEVFAWLSRYAEHDPDWADAYLAVVSQREPRARVWTYDREFRVLWRRPDGTKVPVVPTARG